MTLFYWSWLVGAVSECYGLSCFTSANNRHPTVWSCCCCCCGCWWRHRPKQSTVCDDAQRSCVKSHVHNCCTALVHQQQQPCRRHMHKMRGGAQSIWRFVNCNGCSCWRLAASHRIATHMLAMTRVDKCLRRNTSTSTCSCWCDESDSAQRLVSAFT